MAKYHGLLGISTELFKRDVNLTLNLNNEVIKFHNLINFHISLKRIYFSLKADFLEEYLP